MTAYAHHDVNRSNASWNAACDCMYFGDGSATGQPFTSLDIVAHEFAHGLTSHTAGLTYLAESGGLSEATSDIVGTLVEFAAGNPADEPDYLIGEKTGSTPLRWMDEPNRDGSSASCWNPEVKNLDVHDSSGIGNKFFYTLAVGSGTTRWGTSTPCGNAAPVTGIGNDAAAAIWYRALTAYMVSSTNYSGAREATLTAATDLYGADSPERAAVTAAWLAVGVDGSDPVPAAPVITLPTPEYARVGQPVSLQVVAADPQQQTLTFSSPKMPPGLAISTTGLITGVPTVKGLHPFEVVVTDPDGNSAKASSAWFVKGPPKVSGSSPAAQALFVGVRAVVAVSFTDDFDTVADGAAQMTAKATGVPEGLTVVTSVGGASGNVNVTVLGVPVTAGSGTMVVTATDPDGDTASVTVPWTVTEADAPAEPGGVTVTGGAGTALVEWEDPAAGTLISRYKVRVRPARRRPCPPRRDR